MNKKLNKVWLPLLVSLFILAGCAGHGRNDENTNASKESQYAKPELIVSTQWLSENIDQENLVIIDARKPKLYQQAHIKGAVNATWPQFCYIGKPTEHNHGTLLPNKALAKVIANLGITKNSQVVVYTDPLNGFGEDARLVWCS